jgi:hypothetical protein
MKLRLSDMNKLEKAFFRNLTFVDGDYTQGGIGLDSKRPFGNSNVEGDILEIIDASYGEDGWSEEQYEYAQELYRGLVPHLKRKYLKGK